MGAVDLTVADLERSIAFYEATVGLTVHGRDGGTARLGAGGPDLLRLTAEAGARPARGTTGLYHFALLLPTRDDLARALQRIAVTGAPVQGFADHGVSEALYLPDPDGNGIEIYRDRPRADWPRAGGKLQMFTAALDVQALLGELGPDPGPPGPAPAGTVMGHVHLHVSDLAAAESFYVGALGFDVVQDLGSALFVSAGGYHHHVGLNTWAGVGAPPPPAGSAGLRHAEIRLPSAEDVEAVAARAAAAGGEPADGPGGVLVADPAGNRLLLTSP